MSTIAADDVKIDGLPIGHSWFEQLIQRALKTNAKLKHVHGKRVDEGKGYLSTIASLHMEWFPMDPKLPTRVVVKIPTELKIEVAFNSVQEQTGDKVKSYKEMQDEMAVNGVPFDFLAFAHRNECMAYEMFWADGVPPVPMAKYYYSEHREGENPGVLIMEDLSVHAKTPTLAEGLTYGQLLALAKELAALHAYTLRNPNWNDDGRFRVLSKDEMKGFLEILQTGAKALRLLPEAKDVFTISDEDLDRACKFDELFEIMDPVNKKYHPIIVHGDLWANNFFFGFNGGNSLTDELVAIADWQTTHPGAASEDFVRLLTSSVDHELRRAKQYELIDEYYKELTRLMAPTGIPIPYTAEDVKRLYRKTLRFGVAFMLMHLPVIFANPHAAKECSEKQKAAMVWRVQAGFEDVLKEL